MFNRAFANADILSTATLKRHVCVALDAEIQNEKKLNNLNDEEYIELSAKVWEKFYNCCEQYHIAASQPIGLLMLPDIDYICIIKNKQISLLRPCDQIEISFLSGNYYTTNSPCQQLANDVKNLIGILKSIDESLSMECKAEIDKKLFQLMPPCDIINSEISLQEILKDVCIKKL
jgi:nuclear pore complex protein Nup160